MATPGPFAVYFDYGRTDITNEAAEILDLAAEACLQAGTCRLSVDGHVDTAEAHLHQPNLSLERAANVRAYLANKGVPESDVDIVGLDASAPQVATADYIKEPRNRYAQITVTDAPECSATLAPGKDTFPVKPARPSSSVILPKSLFQSGVAGPLRYTNINDRLVHALDLAGYEQQMSYYKTCGGFALATRAERIKQDGSPFSGARRFVSMNAAHSTIEDFTLSGILSALFRQQPGRYRVIVFLVTDHPLEFSDKVADPTTIEKLPTDGLPDPDPGRMPKFVPVDFYVKALVYEFRMAGNKALFVQPGEALGAQAQLTKINFYRHLR